MTKRETLMATGAFLLASAGAASPTVAAMPASPSAGMQARVQAPVPVEAGNPATAAAITAAANRVAAWQLANLGDVPYVTKYPEDTIDPRSWVQGALYIGLYQWSKVSRSTDLMSTVKRWADHNDYRLGRMIYHADDQAVGRVYAWLVRDKQADARGIAPMRAAFDAILTAPSKADLKFEAPPRANGRVTCVSERWCWCDALFMAPPTWFALSAVTGDPRYREFANKEFWATSDYLFDAQSGLYFRDSRFPTMRGSQGEKLFWSRGNGWVFGGLTQLLETMPANYKDRPRYEAQFRQMAAALVRNQQPSGYWGASILQRDAPPESSGTAFFVYGLQRGISMRLLKEADYRPAVDRGWQALLGAIQPDGRLGYVQQIGDRPDAVRSEDTQLYGSGAFLLAASAMLTRAVR